MKKMITLLTVVTVILMSNSCTKSVIPVLPEEETTEIDDQTKLVDEESSTDEGIPSGEEPGETDDYTPIGDETNGTDEETSSDEESGETDDNTPVGDETTDTDDDTNSGDDNGDDTGDDDSTYIDITIEDPEEDDEVTIIY